MWLSIATAFSMQPINWTSLISVHYQLRVLLLQLPLKRASFKCTEAHNPGPPFSLSLVEAVNGWYSFPVSKDGQLIQQWWLPCNF